MSDVSKTSELIAEIRETHERQDRHEGEPAMCLACSPADWPCDAVRAADALEAATRVPVQGEPNDDREAIAREVYRELYPGQIGTHDSKRTSESDLAESDLAYAIWDRGGEGFAPGRVCRRVADRVLSRATVPDAETEELAQAKSDMKTMAEVFRNTFDRTRAERDASLAAVGRVRAVCAEQAAVRKFNLKIPFESAHLFKKEPGIEAVLAALDGAPEPEVKP